MILKLFYCHDVFNYLILNILCCFFILAVQLVELLGSCSQKAVQADQAAEHAGSG